MLVDAITGYLCAACVAAALAVWVVGGRIHAWAATRIYYLRKDTLMTDLVWTTNVAYLEALPEDSLVIDDARCAWQQVVNHREKRIEWWAASPHLDPVDTIELTGFPVAVVWVPDDRR